MIINSVYNLLVSYSQIQVRAQAYDEQLCGWNNEDVAQGAIIHPSYVVFDPLIGDTFGANLHVCQSEVFIVSPEAMRCIVVPFKVLIDNFVEVASGTHHAIGQGVQARDYCLYFEACEGNEVFYRITLVEASKPIKATYLMDDQWGGIAGKELLCGRA